ncbi:MAG: hypothetical protein HKM04_10585 [Legionellales bacterium]|nr:hypothetical protein [Legionellales bacterium]
MESWVVYGLIVVGGGAVMFGASGVIYKYCLKPFMSDNQDLMKELQQLEAQEERLKLQKKRLDKDAQEITAEFINVREKHQKLKNQPIESSPNDIILSQDSSEDNLSQLQIAIEDLAKDQNELSVELNKKLSFQNSNTVPKNKMDFFEESLNSSKVPLANFARLLPGNSKETNRDLSSQIKSELTTLKF